MLTTPIGGGGLTSPCFDLKRSGGAGAEPLLGVSPVAPLDPLETSDAAQCSPADGDLYWQDNTDCVAFEHRGWHADRKRVYAAMIRTGQTDQRKHDFATCRDHLHVLRRADDGEIKVLAQTCHDRFCLPCGQSRSWRVARALESLMKPAADRLMFITLTLRGRPGDSLRQMIDELRDGWVRLRKLDGWRQCVDGGGVMLEVKWSSTSGGHWHPHYHIICEGRWVDEGWLKRAWSVITRGSDQVKVLPIKEPGAALSYVAKYASKPVDSSFLRRPCLLDEAMSTLKGVRLCACFGTWHGTPLQPKKEPDDETAVLTAWVYEGTLGDLEFRAARADADARQLVDRVKAYLALQVTLSRRSSGSRGNDPAAPPDSAAAAAAG